jgi:hypothetical protein
MNPSPTTKTDGQAAFEAYYINWNPPPPEWASQPDIFRECWNKAGHAAVQNWKERHGMNTTPEVGELQAQLTASEAKVSELEKEQVILHATLGICDGYKVALDQKPVFGSVLVDKGGSRSRISPTTDEAIKLCQELAAAKAEVDQTHREYDEVKRLLVAARKETDRLRAENAWVAVTERMPTAEDADRSGNVELICITDDPLNIYFGAPSDLTAEKTAFTHWRRTNLPALPAPIVDDAAFTKAANHLGYALTDREKAIAKDFWGAAQQSTGGNK